MSIKDKHPEMLKEVELDPEEQRMVPLVNWVALERPIGQPKTVIIRDDTLRSGANTPGVYASIEQKMELAEKLEAIGIVEAEVGYPSIPEHVEFVKTLKQKGSKLQAGVHTRYYAPDYRQRIAQAVDMGADLVNLVGFWGYIMTHALCPDLWQGNIEERVYDAVSYAKSLGARVAIGMDYHRLDLVARFVPAAVDGGADRIVVYDARGWFVPQTLAFLVRYVRALVDPNVEISVHCHNDMGLSTINTIEAIRAGASACDVTVLSTGHRSGNAALEQVVTALEVLYGVSTGIDMRQLCELAELVERLYGVPIPANAPVVGSQMFSYGGSHIAGILRGEWFFWENMRAEAVGSKRYISFGATSLTRGKVGPLYVKVQQMGYDPDSKNMDRVYETLEPLIQKRKELMEPEVEKIIHQVYQGK
jgi:isopropylmalate/homocitrate/citramalate synthase